jgi:4-amino-4-deoxy-L-arabinose transferase-like glycosyltransferase
MNRFSRLFLSPFFAFALVVLAYVMAVTATTKKSVTFDEVAGLIGGYSIWQKNDFRMLPENGSLHQRLAGLPSLWRGDLFPDTTQEAWRQSHLYVVCDQLLYQLGNDADAVTLSARSMVGLMILALGMAVYFCSRSLFGARGALVSVVLFAFSPSFLGHGPLILSDTVFSFFCLVASWALWRVARQVTLLNVVMAGVMLAGAMLAKMSGVIMLPVGLLLVVIRLCSAEPLPVQGRSEPVRTFRARLAVFAVIIPMIGLIVWFCIWAAFGFRYPAFAPPFNEQDRLFPGGWEYLLSTPGFGADVIMALREKQLLPESFLYGALHTANSLVARQSFLNGEFSIYGFRHFFPYAFSVKETVPHLIVLVLAASVVVVAFGRRCKESSRSARMFVSKHGYIAAPFLALAVVYGVFALTSKLNIGHRHLFPLHPPLFVLAGAAGLWFTRRTRWLGAALALLLGWHAIESLAIRPNYLTYFNQFAGGAKNGYKHLVDSSLDWGQDLPGMKAWLDRERLKDSSTPVYFLYFGTGRPDYYGINAIMLPGFVDRVPLEPVEPLQPGVYAISATHFQGIYLFFFGPWTEQYERVYRAQAQLVAEVAAAQNDPETLKRLGETYSVEDIRALFFQFTRARVARLCAWLRAQGREPDDWVNNSILIFRLSAEDLRAAMNDPLPTR